MNWKIERDGLVKVCCLLIAIAMTLTLVGAICVS